MSELGFNKIAAAVLATALGFMGLKEISHSAMHVSIPDTPAYALEIEADPTPGGEVIELPFPQADWVAAMDAERGAKIFKKCTSCHNADNGGGNGQGPNLYDIVGKAAAQNASFDKYSAALTNSGITWDYESLDGFIKKPSKYLSGTAMSFVGVKKDADRAALIEYLRQQSPAPMDKPAVAAAPVQELPAQDMSTPDMSAQDALQTPPAQDTLEETATDMVETVVDSVQEVTQTSEDKAAEDVEDKAAEDKAADVLETAQDAAEDVKEKVTQDDGH